MKIYIFYYPLSCNIIDELSKDGKSFKQIISILEKENRFIDVHKIIKNSFNIGFYVIIKNYNICEIIYRKCYW
jgi:hypothetical protein